MTHSTLAALKAGVTRRLPCALLAAGAFAVLPPSLDAQTTAPVPTAVLVPALPLHLPGNVDSNSPVIWDDVDGVPVVHVLTSVAGTPSLATGPALSKLEEADAVHFTSHPGNGLWMEAVVADDAGTWYGYYHNEVPATELCGRADLVIPRIGAARSVDRGVTWEDLGIILEAPPDEYDCATINQSFVGGVGDESVMLNDAQTDRYIFFSQYSKDPAAQGVAVARLSWADRDAPVGNVAVWQDGIWAPPTAVERSEAGGEPHAAASSGGAYAYPAGTALVPVTEPWHDGDPAADAFWGASVHWNTALHQYVMLLNRAKNENFDEEGVYIAFSPTLEDPRAWSRPQLLLQGGRWYPQVIGLGPGGTDKLAGARARFFNGGSSSFDIEFHDGNATRAQQ